MDLARAPARIAVLIVRLQRVDRIQVGGSAAARGAREAIRVRPMAMRNNLRMPPSFGLGPAAGHREAARLLRSHGLAAVGCRTLPSSFPTRPANVFTGRRRRPAI